MTMTNDDGVINLANRGLTPTIIQSMIAVGNNYPLITSLHLSFNHLGDEGAILVAEYVTSCPSITSLDLGFNQITDHGAEEIGKKLSYHPSLKVLYLSGNSITKIGCSYLALLLKDNQILNRLYLAGNPITPQGAEELSKAISLNSSLLTLDLSSTNIDQSGFFSISMALANEFLNICELYLGNTDCQDDGAQLLASSLQYYRKLEILDLSFNGITEAGFEVFVASLSQYPSLRTLSVANNKLSDKSIKHLILMIQNLNSLQSLSVDYNGFSPMGILAIINSLSLLPSFHKPFLKLSLSGNSMNTESAKALGIFLTHRHGISLQSLHLDHMNIGTQGEQQIAAAIASNQYCQLESLTGILLGPLMIELGSPPQLENFNNVQVLQYVKEMWSTYSAASSTGQEGQDPLVENQTSVSQYGECPDTDEDQEESSHDHQQKPSQERDQSQNHQSIGRKRAASVERNENESHQQLSYPTNTQSEDDLTDLADDVQTHIRTSTGPPRDPLVQDKSSRRRDNSGNSGNNNNSLAETSDETAITREQIVSLMKKLEQIFEPILREVAALPFDPSNLWTLHQYYYSPSSPIDHTELNLHCKAASNFDPSEQLMEIETAGQKKHILGPSPSPGLFGSPTPTSHEEEDSGGARPNKRQSNRFTMTRIAAYPQIKSRLETLKSTSESRLLTILRQLRCIEQYVDKYKHQYPYFLELDVESIILNRNGY